MKTPHRVANYLVVSILLTLLSGAIKYYNVSEKKETTYLLMHEQNIIRESYSLLTSMLDAETGQRGFILTNDSAYLHPYQNSIAVVDQKLKALTLLASDNASQRALVNDKIAPVVNEKLEELKRSLEIYAREGQVPATVFVKKGTGRLSMEHLRSLLEEFRQYHEAMLQKRDARLRTIYVINDTIHYISFALICLVSGYALYVLLQQSKRNNELVASLQDVNRTLEQKVQDRTLELERKTQQTEKLNQDLQDNFEELQSFYDVLQTNSASAEEALLEIRDLYDNAPCGYHSVAPDTTITRINSTELRWLGYTREEVVGKLKVRDIIGEQSVGIFAENFPRFVKEGHLNNLEFDMKRKDGTTFPALLNSTAIYNTRGEFVSSRSIVVDNSERKTLEQQLRDVNARLLRLNEEKNHFLGIATHDLKSPLNGVLGLVNLMKLQHSNLTPDQLQYLNLMEGSCVNMHMLIQNLLDVNRIEQGKNGINKEYIAINSLLKKQYHVFKQTAEKKNISLILEDHVPDFNIHTDPAMLSRILENLISNAIKFSPAHKEVAINVVRTETHIRFEVLDQGPGLSAADKQKLFGKFQRLSARPTGGETSSGLGLSIVKELVLALNGSIVVESEENGGAKFIVQLPLQE
ncbi:CHASE3 domain-containing protein [Chryseolinea soli]|uniref:histidine kinase n=1 Tax=Chryseolinea soli TaxID=2321403 RepID=A0A385SJX3_9BACT|nr:CHASE3 domain-containing protein [Chryseolinea soli]AYB29308.1 PAS domain-containing protein [Chryseolinea soli]